ncbi:hypothetical protein BT69DRAFT_326640 [Atractiella rhizophila]|nr:hypothetical protein BT69DRAFT_326640 [Atractiella rhizophila]
MGRSHPKGWKRRGVRRVRPTGEYAVSYDEVIHGPTIQTHAILNDPTKIQRKEHELQVQNQELLDTHYDHRKDNRTKGAGAVNLGKGEERQEKLAYMNTMHEEAKRRREERGQVEAAEKEAKRKEMEARLEKIRAIRAKTQNKQ